MEQIRGKSDKEMANMARKRELASGLDWNTQDIRARRIRRHKDVNGDDDKTFPGEVD